MPIETQSTPQSPLWTVIGAGPAGIATVGKLLDSGVSPDQVLWVDPAFQGGDLGQKWRPVSSNTKVSLFLDFLRACKSFKYDSCPIDFPLNKLPGGDTCPLHYIADPLQWVTDHLRESVPSIEGEVQELHQCENGWQIKLACHPSSILSKRVVLAVGADPITLPIFNDKHIVPVETMLDPDQLSHAVDPQDTIAVFGSSHTAIIALYNLMELVKIHPFLKVINFYRSPLKYAEYLDGWILYDNTGLKGYSAQWARQHLEDKSLPNEEFPNLERIHLEESCFQEKYKSCTKVIQALGFKRRQTIHLKDSIQDHHDFPYDDQTGRIAPGLYGVGIAFPQGFTDRAGNFEYRVGMWKFMDYIDKVLPIWMAE